MSVSNKKEILKIGNLELGYRSFVTFSETGVDYPVMTAQKAEASEGLEIVKKVTDTCNYVLAVFRYKHDESCWEMVSVGDRLADEEIDWEAFGKLVRKAYRVLDRIVPTGVNEE